MVAGYQVTFWFTFLGLLVDWFFSKSFFFSALTILLMKRRLVVLLGQQVAASTHTHGYE